MLVAVRRLKIVLKPKIVFKPKNKHKRSLNSPVYFGSSFYNSQLIDEFNDFNDPEREIHPIDFLNTYGMNV